MSLCLSLGLLAACQAGPAPVGAIHSAKVEPQLAAAAQALEQGSTSSARTDPQGRLLVYVYVSDTDAGTLQQLIQAGLVDPEASAEMGVVQGWIAPHDLEGVATLPSVKTITLPRYASPR